MLRDPSDCRHRLVLFSAFTLIVASAAPGCGESNQSGDTTPVAKEAYQRQADMYNFMKQQGKVKDTKTAPKATPKAG